MPGDHADHLFARNFQGPGQQLNLTPMSGSGVNRGEYQTLEAEWRNIIEGGGHVEVDVRLTYSTNQRRPDVIRVTYRHEGGEFRRRIQNNPDRGGQE